MKTLNCLHSLRYQPPIYVCLFGEFPWLIENFYEFILIITFMDFDIRKLKHFFALLLVTITVIEMFTGGSGGN